MTTAKVRREQFWFLVNEVDVLQAKDGSVILDLSGRPSALRYAVYPRRCVVLYAKVIATSVAVESEECVSKLWHGNPLLLLEESLSEVLEGILELRLGCYESTILALLALRSVVAPSRARCT